MSKIELKRQNLAHFQFRGGHAEAQSREQEGRTRSAEPRVHGKGDLGQNAPSHPTTTGLTFRYWRLEKILPQPSKSHRRISRFAAFLEERGKSGVSEES